MLRQSPFFDFFRQDDTGSFREFIAASAEDEHYIDWNGFALPMNYGDAAFEYHSIRNEAALTDVSPLRKIRVRGPDAGVFFDHLLTRPVSELPAMRSTYTVMCNVDGNLKDDAILYKFSNDDYLLMPSDIDHSPYFEDLSRTLGLANVSFDECTDAWFGLAVQGPQSATVLHAMGFTGVANIKPFVVADMQLDGEAFYISRMGFTADLGYECWFGPGVFDALVARIRSARQKLGLALPGYGLSALQACRLEGGFIVAGWDCSTELDPIPGFERSPYELGLGWLVNLDAAPFVGRDALREQKKRGPAHTLRSCVLDGEDPPDDGTPVFADGSDDEIGVIACSQWSWGMSRMIGNASIQSEHTEISKGWIMANGMRRAVQLSSGALLSMRRRNEYPAPIFPPINS